MLEENKTKIKQEDRNKDVKLACQVPDLVSGVDINNSRKQQVGIQIF